MKLIKFDYLGRKLAWFVFTALLLMASAPIEAGEKIPLPAHVVLFKAQQLMDKQKYGQAARVLKTFQDQGSQKWSPGDPDPKGRHHYLIAFTRANCHLMANQHGQAIPQYQAAVRAKPDFAPAWMNLAKCLYDDNQYKAASRAFLKGYETASPKKPETLYFAAVCLLSSDAPQNAIALFERLVRTHPRAVKLEWKEAIVQAYLGQDRPRKALPFIEELSKKATGAKQARWREIRLQQYLALDMEKKALRYVKRLIRLYPTEPRWWKGLAHLHLNADRRRQALVALTVKGFLAPLTDREIKLAADLSMALDIPIQAARLYEKMLGRKMTADGLIKIARACLRLHQPETALQWLNRHKDVKANPKAMLLKGEILYEMEKFDQALELFTAAAQEQKQSGYAWLMAGYAAWGMQDADQARHAFEQAAKYPRQRKAAQKGLSLIR